jgi:PAS domain S-box-containing protein
VATTALDWLSRNRPDVGVRRNVDETTAKTLDELVTSSSIDRLREIVRDREDAVVSLLDPDLNLVWVSRPGARAIFGHDPMPFEGRSSFEFIHPDDAERAREALTRAANGETTDYRSRAKAPGENDWIPLRTVCWAVDGPGAGTDIRVVAVTMPTPWPDESSPGEAID